MKKLIISKEMLDGDNNYIGSVDVSKTELDIEISSGLGYIKFKSINTTKSIIALSGSGIKAGWGIEAGRGIEAGWGIKAGRGIKAGSGIKAGDGIKAGRGIKAGDGIEAGLSIKCKGLLKFGYNLFAGTATRKKVVKGEETLVECGKLEGNVVYGDVVELGETETMKGKSVKVIIDGIEYDATIN